MTLKRPNQAFNLASIVTGGTGLRQQPIFIYTSACPSRPTPSSIFATSAVAKLSLRDA